MTSSSWRAQARRRLPGIGWRDDLLSRRAAQVEDLRAAVAAAQTRAAGLEATLSERDRQVQDLGRDLDAAQALAARASFRRQLVDFRRMVEAIREEDPERYLPVRQLPFKLRNYRLAASHGVAAPEVYAVWPDLASVRLAGLPDSFVVKSDVGAGSHGVLPVRRVGPDAYLVAEQTEPVTEQEVLARLAAKADRTEPPYFAEEYLVQPGGPLLPDDVKIYAFHGVVAHVMLRRVGEHGNLRSLSFRYLDDAGADLGRVAPGRRIDEDIPVPDELSAMVGTARHLSRAVGVEFCRVDLYATDRGVVLGEITRAPGGPERYRAEYDEWMGDLWERARWRLGRDLGRGRPPGVMHGPHPAPSLYPPGHPSHQAEPGSWAVVTAPCEQWCGPEEPGGAG